MDGCSQQFSIAMNPSVILLHEAKMGQEAKHFVSSMGIMHGSVICNVYIRDDFGTQISGLTLYDIFCPNMAFSLLLPDSRIS